ncbi:MAG TPA: DEAD/DEAH box helicase, partial [Vicinamibacterales bacterium]
MGRRLDVLAAFNPAVAEWFRASFEAPTPPQTLGWPAIAAGNSTLILAPTGSGKTLTAFLWCINRLMFDPPPAPAARCRVLYISPLKALAVDIERNLRAPLAGIANRAIARGDAFHQPAVSVRTGDTPAIERARFLREPADILITTPESLYLLLTSNAREALRSIDTVIIDEIHALVPTKRGAHLALSLERLEELTAPHGVQRIGLSATQRPLDEVARFLGGSEPSAERGKRLRPERGAGGKRRVAPSPSERERGWGPASSKNADRAIHDEFQARTSSAIAEFRPVTIVDTSEKKNLDLRIEVPVEDMSRIGQVEEIPSGPASQPAPRQSIWSAIHPRLLELVKAHQSTLIFVNSRRIAERLAAALNELAGEPLVRSHHGSLARPQRIEVEDRLKAGLIRGLVATSSLELGIDMGAIDLVIQIEAPPSVASG